MKESAPSQLHLCKGTTQKAILLQGQAPTSNLFEFMHKGILAGLSYHKASFSFLLHPFFSFAMSFDFIFPLSKSKVKILKKSLENHLLARGSCQKPPFNWRRLCRVEWKKDNKRRVLKNPKYSYLQRLQMVEIKLCINQPRRMLSTWHYLPFHHRLQVRYDVLPW